jgi:hypothetical protein
MNRIRRHRDLVITTHQRDLLIDHLDGPAPIVNSPLARREHAANWKTVSARREALKGLVERGLLRLDMRHRTPRTTVMTEKGRAALAAALADWAEALVRAGYGVNGSLTMPVVASSAILEVHQCLSDDVPAPCPAAAGQTAGSSATSTPLSGS